MSATLSAHLPALQVVLPLIAAPFCVILRKSAAAWFIALVFSWVSLGISIMLLEQVLTHGPISYLLGSWPAPWGIEYKVDKLSAFIMLIVTSIGSITMIFAPKSVNLEIPKDRVYLFYTMYLLTFAGLLGITITGDAFNLFVFLEISSLSSYVLISLGSERNALTAALRYLILGTVGATFYIIGVGLMYQMTGTLNIADLAERLPEVAETRTILVALGFVTVGIGLKLGLFPLHVWLPNAYAYAPSVVTAFLAATATKVAVYMLLRVYFTIFGTDIFAALPIDEFLLVLGLIAIVTMSGVAIYQNNAKRLLAYSSVAQVGYMVIGISMVTATGLTATILHLFNHAMIKGALFLALAAVFYRIKSVKIDDMAGLGKEMPYTMAAFVVGGFSLVGVPLTVGFISKWYLILGALEKGWWPVAALILFSSLLAVIYFWKVIEVAYFKPRPESADTVSDVPLSMLIPLWVLVGANIFFGTNSNLTVSTAMGAAKALIGGAP
ncbi:MAG: monovalent cation/H+ antiporter subunit D family protein [Rhodospirillaceae bacterium]|jgi:multicomponent Na+:H+ antiporter subunit D|nr:monovalent cation/H+ antiporter subunit D family protein [Rhodospirillaceae bacterium]MBT4590219.1 monovalent cation/H+ antiporter subunit D family protein [Rhodospirillaceae bacterium]MBT7268749.1 monovalent cation/H+ antiporter subunit D family protein [Rhodospirillaceae bacterium]